MALLSALALLFIGCPTGGDDDGGDDAAMPKGNPIVEDGKYFIISDRVNSWDGIDVRNANPEWGKNAAGWTADKEHTMTIQGWAGAGGSVILAEGEKGTVLNQAYAGNDGMYKIVQKLSWDLINSSANNFRIQGPPTTKLFTIYEITINDGTSDVYKLSTDADIKAIEHGTQMKDWNATDGTQWFLKSGGPTITIMDPAMADVFAPVESIPFAVTASLTGSDIELPEEALPVTASNRTIKWTIDAGTTEATLKDGYTITTINKPGTIKATATVEKGKTESEDFVQEFPIVISEPVGVPQLAIKFAPDTTGVLKVLSSDITFTVIDADTIEMVNAGGYPLSPTTNEKAFAFKIKLPTGASIVDYKQVQVTGTLLTNSWKRFFVFASSEEDPGFEDFTQISFTRDPADESNRLGNTDAANNMELDITASAAAGIAGEEIWVSIASNINEAKVLLSNIKFIPISKVGADVTIKVGGPCLVCSQDPCICFTPVTDISGAVPAKWIGGSNLTLPTAVLPVGATNKTIVWTVKTAGTTATGASITGNILSGVTAAGDVVVVGTVVNGAGTAEAKEDFVKEYTINFVMPAASVTDISYTFAASEAVLFGKVTDLPVVADITGGIKIGPAPSGGEGYGWIRATFPVTFASGVSLTDYTHVEFEYKAIAGDTNQTKTLEFWAYPEAVDDPSDYSKMNAAPVKIKGPSMNFETGVTASVSIPITIPGAIALYGDEEIHFGIMFSTGQSAEFEITNLKFVKK